MLDDYIQGPIVTKDGGGSNSCSDHADDWAYLDELLMSMDSELSDLDELVMRMDSELSDLNELLWQPTENAETKAQETSINANTTTTTSELAPQATLDADMTGQVDQYQASEDEFIPINSLFEELCGNDDNDLATNDLAVQAASDASAAGSSFCYYLLHGPNCH